MPVTAKGMKLGNKLLTLMSPHTAILTYGEVLETSTLICRHATTHHNYMEMLCGENQWEWLDKRVEQIEARITELVDSLPTTKDGPLKVLFQGDPRGCTVKLLIDDMARHPSYDGWALEAIIVPQ